MIYDLNMITQGLKINLRGAIHIGGFVGEELISYRNAGLKNTILFEPQKHLYEIIKSKCKDDERVFNVALGSDTFEADMYISDREGGIESGAGASSSLLEPRKHLTEHPEVTFPTTETVEVCRLDKFLESQNIKALDYNMLNVDVQGYELEVFKGAGNILGGVELIISEVNRAEVYFGCPMVEEIDEFLQQFNFKRVHTYWHSVSWGDGIYVRN